MKQLMETLAACYVTMLHGSLMFSFVPLLLFLTSFWWIMAIYLIWMYIDYGTSKEGGYSESIVNWWRSLPLHRSITNYFPCHFYSSAALEPGKNYLIVSHPHGALAIGAYCCYCTNGNEASKQLAGFKIRHATLNVQFMTPFRRELLMLHGYVNCERQSLINFLDADKMHNTAIVLLVGGMAEVLDARPGSYNLRLKNRTGFIRIALQSGAQLVPEFIFGENDLFDQVNNQPGTKMRAIQGLFKRLFGVAFPILYGCGLTRNSAGLLPYRKPVNVVLGEPIPIKKVENPTTEDINRLYSQYINALTKLFEENKHKYGVPPEQHLNFV